LQNGPIVSRLAGGLIAKYHHEKGAVMPTYNIEDTETGIITTKMMTVAEMEQLLKDNPNKRLIIGSPKIVSGVASKHNKPSEGFRDLLKTIKKHNRGSTMNTW